MTNQEHDAKLFRKGLLEHLSITEEDVKTDKAHVFEKCFCAAILRTQSTTDAILKIITDYRLLKLTIYPEKVS